MPGSVGNDELRHRFIHRLQEMVLTKNVSAATLAKKTGIPRHTLEGWISGRHCPILGDPRRKLIAKALGRSLAWMNGTDPGGDHDGRPRTEDE